MSLSPGDWHRQIPRSKFANVKFRRALLQACRKSQARREAVRHACSQDILFYVNLFVWQYNPRKKGAYAIFPFVTWPFQEEALYRILDSIENDHDLLIEKSREMGASWLCLLAIEWLWHWKKWQKFLVISRNEDAVDDRADPDSLFWKLDYVHDHQPLWVMPKGWDKSKHRLNLSYTNPETRSVITGQASTGKAGVGGRATAMFIDEFSQIKEDYEVLHRTSDTTGCRIFNGTHKGTGTAFHELSQRIDLRKLVMHWTQHPDKRQGAYRYVKDENRIEVLDPGFSYPEGFEFIRSEAPAGGPHPGTRSPWYDRECLRKGSPRAVAMDLDIDPGGSVAQFFNPLILRVLKDTYCCRPYWEGDLSYDQDTGRPLGLVKVPDGPLKLWLHPTPENKPPPALYTAGADISSGQGRTNSVIVIGNSHTGEQVAEYANPNLTPERLAPIATALCWLFLSKENEPAYFAWEHAGPGAAFGKEVVNLGYRNIHYREGALTLQAKKSQLPGWYPSNVNKRLLLEDFRAALDSRQYVARSEFTLKECVPYRYTPRGDVEHPSEEGMNDPTGAGVNHGDRVVASALCWMGMRKRQKLPSQEVEEARAPIGSLAWRRQLALSPTLDPWDDSTSQMRSRL